MQGKLILDFQSEYKKLKETLILTIFLYPSQPVQVELTMMDLIVLIEDFKFFRMITQIIQPQGEIDNNLISMDLIVIKLLEEMTGMERNLLC